MCQAEEKRFPPPQIRRRLQESRMNRVRSAMTCQLFHSHRQTSGRLHVAVDRILFPGVALVGEGSCVTILGTARPGNCPGTPQTCKEFGPFHSENPRRCPTLCRYNRSEFPPGKLAASLPALIETWRSPARIVRFPILIAPLWHPIEIPVVTLTQVLTKFNVFAPPQRGIVIV